MAVRNSYVRIDCDSCDNFIEEVKIRIMNPTPEMMREGCDGLHTIIETFGTGWLFLGGQWFCEKCSKRILV